MKVFFQLTALLLIINCSNFVYAQCDTPSDLQNILIEPTTAEVEWAAVNTARAYRVRYRPTSSSTWQNKRTRNTSLTLTGLIENMEYEWKVKSICQGSSSVYSSTLSFTTNGSCPAPTAFTPLGIGSHQATLVWENLNSQVDSYNIRWKEMAAENWNLISSIGTNLYIVEGLDPLTSYEYEVQSNCTNSSSSFSNRVTWRTPENVCTAPINFTVIATGTDFTTLTWDQVGGTEHYRVRYREEGTAIWLLKDFIFATSTTLTQLFPNTTYEAQVQSECTLGATDWSSPLTFTTDQIASCDPPQNLFANMISASSATHHWDPVVGALSYTLRRRVSGTQSWTFFSTTQTSLSTFALNPGTTYEFQVQTHCTIGDSPYSASAFYTTQEDLTCPKATNLTVDGITPTSADFDWDDVPSVLHYLFQWRIQGSNSWSSVTTTSSHIGRTGLTPSTIYEWQVGSLCTSGGTYTFSDIETFVTADEGQCITPTGLFVMGIGQTQATLIWSSVPEAITYEARIRPSESTTWINHQGLTSNLKVVTGLQPGTEYEWQVRSACSSGSSPFSSSDFFITQSAPSDISASHQILAQAQSRKSQMAIRVHPNPSDGLILIETEPGFALKRIRIQDLSGRILLLKEMADGSSPIPMDLSGILGQGIYLLVAENGKTGNLQHQMIFIN